MAEIRQQAIGENITQAGRDINITTPQPMRIENLIQCPDCDHPVSRFAESCPACGFPVFGYFFDIEKQQKAKKTRIIYLIILECFILLAATYFYFYFPIISVREKIPFICSGLLFFMAIVFWASHKITGRW